MEWFLGLAWEINHCKPGTVRGPAAFSTAVTSLHLCKDKYIQLHTKSRERGYSLTAGSRRVVLYQSGELPQLFLVHYTLEQGRIQHSSPGHIGTLLDFLARKWIFPGFMVFSWPSEARIGTKGAAAALCQQDVPAGENPDKPTVPLGWYSQGAMEIQLHLFSAG